MSQFTTDLFTLKRSLINFSAALTKASGRVKQKFVSDMFYGILASGSLMLSSIARELHEKNKLINTIDRLSKHLQDDVPKGIDDHYKQVVWPLLGQEPVILVDDTDIVKPYGKAFESLSTVRDGSSLKKPDLKPGYFCTEIVALSKDSQHPFSLFSQIYSSKEKGFESSNTITDRALGQLFQQLPRPSTFVFDRGYDRNSLFQLFADANNPHYYVIRLTNHRKLTFGHKTVSAPTLCQARKGKIRMELPIWNAEKSCLDKKTAYVSHLKVKITAHRQPIQLVLVYDFAEKPMMLATNRPIRGKSDVETIVRLYLSRWRIEEYFRMKKQSYGFERFRIRNLWAINNLNRLLNYALGFMALLEQKKRRSGHFAKRILSYANALREKVSFYGYRFALAIQVVFHRAREGTRGYYAIRGKPRPSYLQQNFFSLIPAA